MKVIFMGTPDFAVPALETIVESGYNVELVITQMDRRRGRGKKVQYPAVKEKALELGLEVYQPENVNTEESIEKIKSLEPDFIVVAAYGQILRTEILEIPKYNIINIHASLLPKYRGASPINWAIVNGDEKTGITIMEVEEGLDTGDMVLKEEILIEEDDDASIIHDKLAEIGGCLVVKAMKSLEDGTATLTPQDDELSSYASKLSREDGEIDWSKTAIQIRNQVRGFKPWPSAFTNYKEERMTVHWIDLVEEDSPGEIGEIVKVSKDGIYVKTGDGLAKIVELQFPGNRSMKAEDYLRGNNIEEGIILK